METHFCHNFDSRHRERKNEEQRLTDLRKTNNTTMADKSDNKQQGPIEYNKLMDKQVFEFLDGYHVDSLKGFLVKEDYEKYIYTRDNRDRIAVKEEDLAVET